MTRPRVKIALSNGGLNLLPPSENGTSAVLIAAPVAPVAGYGVAFLLKTKAQAKTAFGQAGNEVVLDAIVEGFFAEAPEGTKLYVCCMAPTATLTVLTNTENAEKVLIAAAGQARIMGFVKFPAVGYTPTVAGGFDGDVHTAVSSGQALANTWFERKKPFRFFVQGYGFTTASDAKDYAIESSNPARNAHIVVGAVGGSTARATLLVMGRAARVEPQSNIGRVRSGSLNIPEAMSVTIGDDVVEVVAEADLDTLHEKRYISFERNQTASGYIVTDDNSLTYPTDDYNNLRYGRVIDNATRVAFNTYYQELKDDVEVSEGGRLAPSVERALENSVETAIDAEMRGQLSKLQDGSAAVECLVNPDPQDFAALYEANGISNPNFNILQTGGVYLFLRLRPKACIKFLDIFLGYTA